MKYKLLRTVSTVMLSVLLAVTAVASPAAAAGNANQETCKHPSTSFARIQRVYTHVTDQTHYYTDYYVTICTTCEIEIFTPLDSGAEGHAFNSNHTRCVLCGYTRH